MNLLTYLRSRPAFALVLATLMAGLGAHAQGTAFTYQGQLNYGGSPASGAFDLTFTLYTGPSGGTPASPALTNLSVGVSGGTFAAPLDFGPGVFNGQTYWLELAVRTNGAANFTTLEPRTEVFPAPYAIYAETAGSAGTATTAGTATSALSANTATTAGSFSGALSGDVTGTQGATVVSQVGGQSASAVATGTAAANGATSANIAGALVARDANGSFAASTVTATNFAGNAFGLVNVPAASITGFLTDTLLTNVALLNAANNLTNVLTATNPANQFNGTFIGSLAGNASTATSATTAASFSGSLSGDVTGTQGATVVSFVGGQSASSVSNATVAANGATSANIAGAMIARDANGSFAAGTVAATNFAGNASGLVNVPAASITGTLDNTLLTNVALLNAANNLTNVLTATNPANQFSGTFTGSLAGNASTATSATTASTAATAASFSGSLSGDVTGTQGATVVSFVGGQSASSVSNATVAANNATSANIASAIVARDANGSFSAGTITATNFSGNGSGLTNIPAASITGTLDNTLLTNVALLDAANTLTNVLTATNPANQFRGTFIGSLTGNASTATSATSAATATTATTAGSFSGSLSGDVTGTQSATVVSLVGGESALAVSNTVVTVNSAASANTSGALVTRDATGSFSAGTVTATNFIGNGIGLTNIPAASITGTLDNTLLTNVALLDAANTLTNVLIATNPANQLSGTFTGSLTGNATTATAAASAATATTATTAGSFSGSLSGDVTGTQGATVVSFVGSQSALAVSNTVVTVNNAASANIANALVARDANGSLAAGAITATNFCGNGIGLTNIPAASITGTLDNTLLTNVALLDTANTLTNVLVATNPANQLSGTFTGSLAGNASTATSATSATTAATAASFSGSLSGDVTGTQNATVVSLVGGQSASAVSNATIAANGATSANTANALVARDANGSFFAGTVIATNFTGNGIGLTNLPASSITGALDNTLFTNVALLDAANTLTNVLVATNPANQLSGTFTGSLTGNASTATSATSATTATTATTAVSFSGALSGDVTGTQGATVVSSVGGESALAVSNTVVAVNNAVSTNAVSALVARDATGSFSAGTVTATNFTGNGIGLTNVPAASITGALANTLLTNVALINTANTFTAANTFTGVVTANNSNNRYRGILTGSLSGNATSATSATIASSASIANSFSGSLLGDVTGGQRSTVVSYVGGLDAADVANGASLANSATGENIASALVARDSNGNFSTHAVTAAIFLGDGSSVTNYQGTNLVDTATQNSFAFADTNATIPFQHEGAIYQVVSSDLCFSNITGLGPGYNKMTIYLQAANPVTVSWLPGVNLVGAFTTNGLQLTNSQGWYVMALTVLGTNWQANTCTYAICPPNQ